MNAATRWFWVGSRPQVQAALAATFGVECTGEPLAAAGRGDLVVVDPVADREALAALPHGHAFSGVQALKQRPGLAVYVVVDAEDPVGVQLARFCLADGVLYWHAGPGKLDVRELAAVTGGRSAPSVDALLERLQADAGAAGRETSLQRLLRFEREDSLSNRLQDPDTGLYDGPYATLKLDEEWKRARRFHQPLSLLLVDLGLPAASLADADRRAALADAAGVFLNECRDIDVLARFSPEVFLLLLPGTGPAGAEILARRIVEALAVRLGHRLPVRPAVGLCTVPSAEIRDRRSFLAVAESCLERARTGGGGGVAASWQ